MLRIRLIVDFYNFEYLSDKIMFDAFSPIIITGALVFPVVNVGIIDASATRSPPTP